MATRKTFDGRRLPVEADCTLVLAGAEPEVTRDALVHLETMHGFDETDELRGWIQAALEDERPLDLEPGRKVLDLKGFSGQAEPLTIAGDADEVIETAAQHAVSGLGHPYSTQLMDALRGRMHEVPPKPEGEEPRA